MVSHQEPGYLVRLFTGLLKPRRNAAGNDLAGHVEAAGRNVTQFEPGDGVIGNLSGALAEYERGREGNFVLKPPGITFVQAAALPVDALAALQGLRDAGQVRAEGVDRRRGVRGVRPLCRAPNALALKSPACGANGDCDCHTRRQSLLTYGLRHRIGPC